MEYLGDYQWVLIIGAFLGAFLAPFAGYLKRPSGKQTVSTVHGATILDSSIGHAVVTHVERTAYALERLADAAERIEKQTAEIADQERQRAEIAAAIQAERIKWEQENKRK